MLLELSSEAHHLSFCSELGYVWEYSTKHPLLATSTIH